MKNIARTGFVPTLEGMEPRYLLDAGATVLITLASNVRPNYWANPIQNSSLIQTWDLVPGLGLYALPAGLDVNSAMATISKNPSVVRVELNRSIESQALSNDPLFSSQWGLKNTGQNGGLVGADTHAMEALAKFSGTGNTIVAVIDSGVDYTHPELASRMWINPGEIPGNGIDDDKDGIVDDVYGANFVNGSGNPMDDNGHGTHVAGIIAASMNNNVGIVGMNPNTRIMALKFLNAKGEGTLSGAISALNFAVIKGARLSNNSWGGAELSPTLSDAINKARLKGHVLVAAAGNDSLSDDTQALYPAGFTQDNIVSVASSSNKDQLSWFSNYGKISVDIAAPGDNILSTLPGNQYGLLSGTSMATPMVSGAIALLWDRRPDLPYQEILKALYQGVDLVPSLADKVSTKGRLNVARSLELIDKLPLDRIFPFVTNTSFSGDRSDQLNSVRMEFSEPMDQSSLFGLVQVKGPGGNLIPVTWKALTGNASTVFEGSFADQSILGSYTLTISPKVKDQRGNLLDQNHNSVGGEPGDSYTGSITLTGSKNYISTNKTPIRDLKTSTSSIVIPDLISLQRIQVNLNITHTDVSDLVVNLVSPWGQTFKLINRDVKGANLRDIVFEDLASSPLNDGVAPYRGTYRPNSPMGNFSGKNGKGIWTLSMSDQAIVDQGSLNSWSIRFLPDTSSSIQAASRLNGASFIKKEAASNAGQISGPGVPVLKSMEMPNRFSIAQRNSDNTNSPANHEIRGAGFFVSGPDGLLGKNSFVLVDRTAFLDHFFFAIGSRDVVVGTAASAPAGLPAAITGAGHSAATKHLVAKKAELFAAAAVVRGGPLNGNAAIADRGEGVVRLHDEPGFVGVEVGLGEKTKGPTRLSV